MKKFLFISLIFLSYLTGCCNGSFLLSPEEENGKKQEIQHLMESTSALLLPDSKNEKYRIFCSAVWISPTKLISARHCGTAVLENDLNEIFGIEPELEKLPGTVIAYSNYMEQDYLVGVGEKPHFAVVVGFSRDADLVLLESVDEENHQFAQLTQEDTWTGQTVQIVGHTRRLSWNYMDGIVSAPHRDIAAFFSLKPEEEEKEVPMRDVLHLTAMIAGGNSGGGAFNDRGELVGICSFMIPSAPGASFFVPENLIKEFLQEEFVIPNEHLEIQ